MLSPSLTFSRALSFSVALVLIIIQISQIIPQGGFQHLEVDSEVHIARGCKLDIAVKFMERKLQSVLDKGAREHIDDFLLMLEGATESYQMYSLHILVDAGNGE